MKKLLFLVLFLGLPCQAGVRHISGQSDDSDRRAININFNQLEQAIENSVLLTTTQTVQGKKYFLLVDITTLTCSSCTFQALNVIGALSAATLNTGQGVNELYDMDQNVQTTDNPTFSSMTITNRIRSGNGTSSLPSYSFTNDTSMGIAIDTNSFLNVCTNGDCLIFGHGANQFYPNADNTYDWGRSSNRWSTIFAANGTINTSALDEKRDISIIEKDEIKLPRAIRFKWKNKEGNPDDREYFGFAADDLPLEAHPKNEDGTYDMKNVYTNAVISMLLAEVHDLRKEVNNLKER